MKIILVRHGEAESVSPEGDRNRKLTTKGIEDIHKIGAFIRNANLRIAQIYYSPYLRTKHTADILAEELHLEDHTIAADELCAGRDCSELLPDLCSYTNSDAIILVGHNPDIAYFLSKLLGQSCETNLIFSPGTTVAVNVPKEKFSQGQILWVVSPDFLSCEKEESKSDPALV